MNNSHYSSKLRCELRLDLPTHAVLYHANCPDGFGAAWAVWRKLGDRAIYFPVSYGTPPPEQLFYGGFRHIFMVDFSYPLADLQELARRWSVVIIDHHKTALSDLEAFARDGLGVVIYDQEHSGAYLTWQYFHPDDPVPPLVEYLEDRDLWRWELPFSKEASAAIGSHPQSFVAWDAFVVRDLIRDGGPILRYQEQQVQVACARAVLVPVASYRVPCVNTTTLISEIGNELCRQHPDAPFSATFFIRPDGKEQWSLRSIGEFDVSAVAQLFEDGHGGRGGGHRNAAGFTQGGIGINAGTWSST